MKTVSRLVWRAGIILLCLLAANNGHGALNVTISNGTQSGGSFAGGVWTPTSSPSVINVTNLLSQLNSNATVTINTNVAGAEAGDITISAVIGLDDLTTTGGRTLTLNATDDILVNAALSQSQAGGDNVSNLVNLVFNANSDNSGGGSTTFGANVDSGGGSITVSGVGFTQNAAVSINTGGGAFSSNLTGSIALTGNSLNTSGGNVTCTAVTGMTWSSAITSSGGSISGTLTGAGATFGISGQINAGGGAGTGSVDARANAGILNLNATALLSSGGGGLVKLLAATSMTLDGDVSTSGGNVDIDVTGTGNLLANSTSSISAVGGANAGDISVLVNNGNITLNSGSQFVSGSSGDVAMNNNSALNDFTAAGAITGGTGGVVLSSRRHFTHSGTTTANGGANQLGADMDFDDVGDASIGGIITLNGSGTLSLRGSDTSVSALVDSNGNNITIQARNDATVSGDVITDGGNVQISASGSVAGILLVTTTGLLDARGGANTGIVTLSNAAGNITNNGEVRSGSGGRLFAQAGGANGVFNQSGIFVGGTEVLFGTTVRANNGVVVSQPISGTGHVSLFGNFDSTGGGDVTLNAAANGNGGVTLGGASVTGNGSGTITAQNNLIDINATGAVDLVAAIDSNGGNISVTAGTTLDLGTGLLSSDGGVVTLLSTNAMNLFGPVTTSGGAFNADVTGAGALAIQNDITTSGGNVDITTFNGLLSSTAGSDVNASGGAGTAAIRLESLSAAQNLQIGAGVTSGTGGTNLRAGGDVTINGIINGGGGAVQLVANTDGGGLGSLNVNVGVSTTGSGTITLRGVNFTQTSTGTIGAGGGNVSGTFSGLATVSRTITSTTGSAGLNAPTLNINAQISGGGGVTLGGASVTGNASGTITAQNNLIGINATGAVDIIAAIDSNGGNISVTAGTTLDLGTGLLSSDGGVVTLLSTNAMNLFGPVTTSGGAFNADVTGAGALAIQNDITTSGGNVDITTFNGLLSSTAGSDVNASGGAGTAAIRLESLSAAQNLQIGAGVTSGTGGTNLRAGGDVTINGIINGGGGAVQLVANTDGGGLGSLNVNVGVSTTGSGVINMTGRGFVQGGTGTLTTAGGSITGTFSNAVTIGAAFSSNGGQISVTATPGITVNAQLSTAPPAGSGVLHASSGVALNVPVVLGNADIILIGTNVTAPVVTNPSVAAITTTTARMGGNVTNTGGMNILERGIVFSRTSLNSNPLIGGANVTKLTTAGSTGVFTINASALLSNTGYSFKAFARNIIGATYTTPVSTFTTSSTEIGLVDSTFDAGSINGAIYAMAELPDGKILVGGDFTSIGGQSRLRLARLTTTGAVDATFSASVSGTVFAIAIQGDGKIVIGGNFTSVNSTTVGHVARLNANGTLDSTFNPGTGADAPVLAIAIRSGDIFLGGVFGTFSGQTAGRIVRLGSNGVPNTAFATGSGFDGNVYALSADPSGAVLVGGIFSQYNGQPRANLASVFPNGNLDATVNANFGSGPNGEVFAIARQADNKILLGGNFTQFNGNSRTRLARLTSTGVLEGTGTFNATADSTVFSLAVQTDGKIIACGDFSQINSQPRVGVARLFSNGSVEGLSTFNPGSGGSGAFGALLKRDGSIQVNGSFTEFNGTPRAGLARLKNGPATYSLGVVNARLARWLRGGTAPEIQSAEFAYSTDGGTSWSALGNAVRVNGGWEISSGSLPPVGELRAQAGVSGAYANGSRSLAEDKVSFSLPGLRVFGNGNLIANGASPAIAANLTEFETVQAPGVAHVDHTFVIENVGGSSLTLTENPPVSFAGATPDDFTLIQPPATTIPAGGSTSFTVRFNPALPGLSEALVNISSNDAAFDPFTFQLIGRSSVSPAVPQKIIFLAPQFIYQGQAGVSLTAYSTADLPVSLSIVQGAAFGTLAGNVLTPVAPGVIKIAATQAGEPPVGPAVTVVKTIVVKPQPTAPTLVNLLHSYDGAPQAANVIGNTGAATITYNGSSTAPTAAGIYDVVADVDSVTLKGKLVINKAPLFVLPQSARRFITQPNPALVADYSGLQLGDTLSSVLDTPPGQRPTITTTAKTSSPGGRYPITATGGKAANYTLMYIPGHLVVETFAGSFEALLEDTATGLPVGKVEFTVASNSTLLTGVLQLTSESAPMRFKGSLSLDLVNQTATGTIPPIIRGVNSYAMTLNMPFGREFSMDVTTNSAPTHTFTTADGRAVFVPAKGQLLKHAGAHTMILEPGLPDGATVPAGAGHATTIITPQGVMKIAGRLADGVVLTAALKPGHAADYRLFARPYKRTNSHISGWLDLAKHPSLSGRRYLPSGTTNLLWQKTASQTDKSYRSGFGPVTTGVIIDPWLKPSAAQPLTQLLGIPAGDFGMVNGNIISASTVNLPTDLLLNPLNKISVTLPAANATNWSGKINPATGQLTGKFTLTDSIPAPTVTDPGATRNVTRTVPFSAAFRQPHGIAGNLGAGNAQAPALPTDATNEIQSGLLRFDP